MGTLCQIMANEFPLILRRSITGTRGSRKMDKSYDDVMGVVWYINEDGIREYACRGIGAKYSKFYKEWIPNSSYRFVRMDWPWDMFVFDNPTDHDRLVNDFPEDVYEDTSWVGNDEDE